jgi:hypothetical protein
MVSTIKSKEMTSLHMNCTKKRKLDSKADRECNFESGKNTVLFECGALLVVFERTNETIYRYIM